MLRVTTLSENTASQTNVLAEWGLSILVETDETSILFDTGRGISASHNVDILGVDLSRVSRIVLSHGHLDHTGGLRCLLRRMKREIEIVAHPDIWAAKYSQRQGQGYRYVGIPFERRELESLGANFNLTSEPVKLGNNIMTTGEVPMVNGFEAIEPRMFVKSDIGWQPDKVMDDRALIITSEAGLVVVLGCAHRGIINTVYHAQKLTGVKEIHCVVGGSHLIGASDDRMRLTIDALKEMGVQRLSLCHCTGLPAITRLAGEFGEQFTFNVTGTTIDLP